MKIYFQISWTIWFIWIILLPENCLWMHLAMTLPVLGKCGSHVPTQTGTSWTAPPAWWWPWGRWPAIWGSLIIAVRRCQEPHIKISWFEMQTFYYVNHKAWIWINYKHITTCTFAYYRIHRIKFGKQMLRGLRLVMGGHGKSRLEWERGARGSGE